MPEKIKEELEKLSKIVKKKYEATKKQIVKLVNKAIIDSINEDD